MEATKLNSLEASDASQLRVLRSWLLDEKGGANFLRQSESRQWEDTAGSSFVRVNPSKDENDVFTKFVVWLLVSVGRRTFCTSWTAGRIVDVETGLISYDDSKITKSVTLITTVLSSTFPVISILVLYLVKNTYGRIGIAAGFTAFFAFFLATFSSARRVEIFAATAT